LVASLKYPANWRLTIPDDGNPKASVISGVPANLTVFDGSVGVKKDPPDLGTLLMSVKKSPDGSAGNKY
jgi:hypothetical protein